MSGSGLQGYGPEAAWFYGRMATWTATPVQMENAAYAPNPANPEPFVRFSVQGADAQQASLGEQPTHRHWGMAIVEIHVPSGSATGVLDELCDAAAALFRTATPPPGLRLRTPRAVTVGGRGAWYRRNVLIPFQRDTVFATT